MGQKLDELIDELSDENRSSNNHDNISWGSLSDSDYQRRKSEVFRDLKLRSKQRRVAAEVSEIDRANEARKRSENEGD